MGFDVTKDVTFSDGTTQKGKANLGINSLNLKIGGKHGKSFYFRWELGWSLALSSPAFEVVATNNGITKNENFTSPIKGSGPIADIGPLPLIGEVKFSFFVIPLLVATTSKAGELKAKLQPSSHLK